MGGGHRSRWPPRRASIAGRSAVWSGISGVWYQSRRAATRSTPPGGNAHATRPARGRHRARTRPRPRADERAGGPMVDRAGRGRGGRRHLADVDARRIGAADRRDERVGRVRRDRQPGNRPGRPHRARGRLRHLLGLHGDAQGDVDLVVDPRAGPARPPGEQRRCLRGHRRRAVFGRLCGDRWRARAARRRRGRGRRHRLGRCHEHVRRGDRRIGAAARVQPGAARRWRLRQWHRHERQRRRLGRVVHTEPTGAGIASGPGSGSVADSRARRRPPDPTAEPSPTTTPSAPTPEPTPYTEAHPVDRADRDRTLDTGRHAGRRSRAC